MPLPAPNLDDRQFADIVSEAKALVPRYAPAWTNLNEADPGVTLIELFAWMTESVIYRLNQVPDRNYLKFLDLIGIRQTPAQAARVDLTFTPSRPDIQTFSVPKGTQVAVANTNPASGGSAPVVFETDEGMTGFGATLAAVQTFDGFAYTLETVSNLAAGQFFYPFGPRARANSALMLGFDSTLPFPSDQLNLAVWVYTQGLSAMVTQCTIDLAKVPPAASLRWQYWDGGFWQDAGLDKDETRAFTRDGHIYLRVDGTKIAKAQLGSAPGKLYWIRALLEAPTYEIAPRLQMVLTNTVPATNALTVNDEVVGGSNGRPNQTFQLKNSPVVDLDQPVKVKGADGRQITIYGLRLEIDEGLGFAAWQEVSDFLASAATDPHYTLDHASGQIAFGARIPLANATHPNDNIVARQYRFGGGAAGNVGANTATQIQTYVDSVKSVTNLRPSAGGSDTETLDAAKLRAPSEIKSQDRAVTPDDFVYLAQQTPGVRVRRALALPLTHPKFLGAKIPGVITVVVVPESDAPNPLPSQSTLVAVCAQLNAHRLLTCELYVMPPTFREVKIDANIVATLDADLGTVRNGVVTALNTFFHALTGGDDGQGWPFGGTIYYSTVYRVILAVDGVARILDNQLVIWLDGERQTFCRDVPIGTGELLYSGPHNISVSYGQGT